ncbi:uncharacterized protein TNCV_4596961 [Trichonephila clavipes]|uniref:Uncharacterized protein n=1 Tax=Trichonephila clavipes TaxID=2585209 RepID=A0A8X6WFH8_TRICX|nr:uncharacterized protein TNCV_4596961 [Trichonephila clavipes]
MPPNTLRVHTEYVLVKSVEPKILWEVTAETTSAGDWTIFPSSPILCLNCGGGDRWCHHLSPISRIGLRKMIMKFEETGNLGVLPGKGRKLFGTETVEEVAAAVVERASSSIYFLASGHASWRFCGRQYEKFCDTF